MVIKAQGAKGCLWIQEIHPFPYFSLSVTWPLITLNVWFPISLQAPTLLCLYGLLLLIGWVV